MSLDPLSLRPGAADYGAAQSLQRPSLRPVEPSASPIDHLHDELAGGLARVAASAEAGTKKAPILGALVQFLVGAGSAVVGMAEGMWQTVRHPIQAIKGLWTMVSHVPLSPMWLWRGLRDGFGATLSGDKVFWGMVGKAFIAPYAKDWSEGRYFAVAGRAAVDIGTVYVGVKQAKTAFDGWRANRAAKAGLADAGLLAEGEEGLKAALLGKETTASGQVMGEGATFVGPRQVYGPHRPAGYGQRMLARGNRTPSATAMPTPRTTRAQLERAASHFKGPKQDLRTAAIVQLEQDQALYRSLGKVGAERLRKDPVMQQRFKLLTESVDTRMDAEIFDLVGFKPEGAPKAPIRAAHKLDLMKKGDKNLRLANLEDLTRGRINLDSLNTSQMRGIVKTLREHYGQDNIIIHDYLKGKPFYRGRLHVKMRDASGLWYELQVGPRQISQFYDTPFTLVGRPSNIHDAVYKGLLWLKDDAIKVLGKGDLSRGKARLAGALDIYVDHVDEVVAYAKQGRTYDFASRTQKLQRVIADLIDELPADKLPLGLTS